MKNFRPLLPAAALLLLAGCNVLPEPQSDNTRYYVLEGAAAAAPEAPAVRLGLRRVEIPAYLKTKAMVVRTGGNELRYAESARWAEPLEAGLARALRDQLAARAAVSSYPFPAQQERDYDVTVHVTAAEGADEGVRFSATFELARASDGQVVARRSYAAPAAEWRGDHARLAAQLSVAVAGLAGEIIAAVPAK